MKDEIEKGSWNGVTVKWERGHPVTLVLYDEEDNVIERHDIEGWSVDRVQEALKTRGFHGHHSAFPNPTLGFSNSGAPDRTNVRLQPVDPSSAHSRKH